MNCFAWKEKSIWESPIQTIKYLFAFVGLKKESVFNFISSLGWRTFAAQHCPNLAFARLSDSKEAAKMKRAKWARVI